MAETVNDWRNFPHWSDDQHWCTFWATEIDGSGQPSGRIVRCTEAPAHDGAHHHNALAVVVHDVVYRQPSPRGITR